MVTASSMGLLVLLHVVPICHDLALGSLAPVNLLLCGMNVTRRLSYCLWCQNSLASLFLAGRRSRTPERDAIAASERLRSGELNRRKSRNMSLESIGSASTRELENDQLRLEKKNLEEEISRIGKHLDEIRRESSLVTFWS